MEFRSTLPREGAGCVRGSFGGTEHLVGDVIAYFGKRIRRGFESRRSRSYVKSRVTAWDFLRLAFLGPRLFAPHPLHLGHGADRRQSSGIMSRGGAAAIIIVRFHKALRGDLARPIQRASATERTHYPTGVDWPLKTKAFVRVTVGVQRSNQTAPDVLQGRFVFYRPYYYFFQRLSQP